MKSRICLTQWFEAGHDMPSIRKPGRYRVLFKGQTRPCFRWWTGQGWQFNRRKGITVMLKTGDRWRGVVQ